VWNFESALLYDFQILRNVFFFKKFDGVGYGIMEYLVSSVESNIASYMSLRWK